MAKEVKKFLKTNKIRPFLRRLLMFSDWLDFNFTERQAEL